MTEGASQPAPLADSYPLRTPHFQLRWRFPACAAHYLRRYVRCSRPVTGCNTVRLSAETGELSVLVEEVSKHVLHVAAPAAAGTDRELVAVMRITLGGAEQGASAMLSTVEEVE